ncbi:MAG: pantetheine-phosphate adenylyltransferase [Candidatus Thorarchaeota archaeon]
MGEWLYHKVVFAGTFDHLHAGHKHLLRTAIRLGEYVAIGLTTDEMLSKKSNRESIQSFGERKKALLAFIESEGEANRCSIFPIETKEGGADKMEDLEALIVSDEINVVNMAFQINELRINNGLKRFHIIVIPRVRTGEGSPLSSSRKREGETFDDLELVY